MLAETRKWYDSLINVAVKYAYKEVLPIHYSLELRSSSIKAFESPLSHLATCALGQVSSFLWAWTSSSVRWEYTTCLARWLCAWSLSCVWLFATPWSAACQAPLSVGVLQVRILDMSCHALLQGIFLTPGSNPGLLHCRWILHWLSPSGKPCKVVTKTKGLWTQQP